MVFLPRCLIGQFVPCGLSIRITVLIAELGLQEIKCGLYQCALSYAKKKKCYGADNQTS